jgi:CBS domain containing-hemolysin-like protein
LTEVRRKRQHMAVVIGPRGRVTGLVTMHDLIEEVIGEINEGAQGETPRRR